MYFGEQLRRLRIEKGLSQQQLAEQLYVDRSTLASWETGRRVPDAAMIAQLSGQLSTDVSVLLRAAEAPAARPRGAIFLESLFSSLLMPLLTVYLLYCAGENRRKSPALYVVCTLWVVYFVLLILTQFTTAIYTVTDRNMYQRGPWYPLLLAPAVLLMAVNLVALVHYGAALSRRQRKAFAVYLIVPLACMLVQMAVYGLLMIVIGTCVAALFLFLFMMWDQMDRYIAQHEENARLHFHTMVLQMRPHFLYNVMNSIYFLIQQDPEKAQQGRGISPSIFVRTSRPSSRNTSCPLLRSWNTRAHTWPCRNHGMRISCLWNGIPPS